MIQATATLILDTRRALKDGTFPVKLRVTHSRVSKYFPTIYAMTEEDYDKARNPKARGEYKKLGDELSAINAKANAVIGQLPAFSFEAFAKRFSSNTSREDVFDAYVEAMDRLRAEGQVGTARNYECAFMSLLAFTCGQPPSTGKGITMAEAAARREALISKRKPLPFAAVTEGFLRDYDRWMVRNGKSLTTISMYLRTLRTLFNDAIAAGDVLPDLYPFGRRKYQIPASGNTKKALAKEDIRKIFDFVPRTEAEARARDLWCFSYLCNGINTKDIARLRYRQVGRDSIDFVRAKTERTTRHAQKAISVALDPKAALIIERWGNRPALPDAFVFPILTEGLTPEREMRAVKQAVKTINKYMDRIAKELGIEGKVRTYTARHSFSTVLKRAGVSTAEISEALGHSSEKTTQSYLDSFGDDTRRKIAAHLTDF